MVDEGSGYEDSNFYHTKSGIVEPACAWFEKWWQVNNPLKMVQQGNARENKTL